MSARNQLYLCYIPLLTLLGACLVHSLSVPWSDFAGYYYGSRELLRGHFQNAYDMERLNALIAADGYRGVLVSYAPFPPFTSLVIAPFTLFPMGPAKLLFNCCSCIFFVCTMERSRRFFSVPLYLIVLLPFIFLIPLVNNIQFGQSYLLLCCLLLEGYMAFQQGKKMMYCWWGLAILFKVFPAVILVFLLIRKQYRHFFFLGVACCILLLASVWINGFAAWKLYVFTIVPKVNNGELNDSFTFIFQSAFMLGKRIFIYDQLLNPHPVYENPYLFIIAIGIFKAFVLSCAIARKNFAVWIAASMLISPNGSSYSLILWIIPLWALAAGGTPLLAFAAEGPGGTPLSALARRRFVLPAVIVLLAVACAVPVQHFSDFPVWAQFPRLYLLVAVFCLLALPANVPLLLALSVLFIGLDWSKRKPLPDPSSYVLATEAHIFMYDYSIKQGELFYAYRDDTGGGEADAHFPVAGWTQTDISIRDNQLYYKGEKLTDSPDTKKKALLVNGIYIIYLSDLNRGYGFYTLRKLPVTPAVAPPAPSAISAPAR